MTASADVARPLVIRDLEELCRTDTALAGGKGANLGELMRAGFPVPPGFVITSAAYAAVRDDAGIADRVTMELDAWRAQGGGPLDGVAEAIRDAIRTAEVPAWLRDAIVHAHRTLTGGDPNLTVAVRSSAITEDAPSASFAGMHESFLNVAGADATVDAVRACWASLFGPRTVAYRAGRGLEQATTGIAVVVQRQIRSTRSGVLFTVDPASGDRDRIVVEAARGLGESVVSGRVTPDRYVVDKHSLLVVARELHAQHSVAVLREGGGTSRRPPGPDETARATLTDDEVVRLASLAVRVEQHYGYPQDAEWTFDADDTLWMLQTRPITTAFSADSPRSRPGAPRAGTVVARGLGAAPGQASGSVRHVTSRDDAAEVGTGDVVVTRMTAPEWVPVMRRAAAIVTDVGGMTCHAAIVAREIGIPCVVGTDTATTTLAEWETVTVDATYGAVIAGTGTAALPERPYP